jgi:hypothetical protein
MVEIPAQLKDWRFIKLRPHIVLCNNVFEADIWQRKIGGGSKF